MLLFDDCYDSESTQGRRMEVFKGGGVVLNVIFCTDLFLNTLCWRCIGKIGGLFSGTKS